jgi:hypothetical protein
VGFIFAVTSWHARQKRQNFARQRPGAQAATEPAKAFVSRAAVVLSLFLGGGGGSC